MTPPQHIGVGFSGGGSTSAAFALGVLVALYDAGLNDKISTVSSVSGGSYTNAYFSVRETPLNQYNSANAATKMEPAIEELAQQLAGRRTYSYVVGFVQAVLAVFAACALGRSLRDFWEGSTHHVDQEWALAALGAMFVVLVVIPLFFGPHSLGARSSWWGSWVYSGIVEFVVVFAIAMTVVGTWHWTVGNGWIRAAVLVAMLLGLLWMAYAVLIAFAGPETSLTYDHAFLGGKRRLLSGMNETPQHVFGATEHHSGHHLVYARNFVYNFHFGISLDQGTWSIRKAVRASSALPPFWPQVNQRLQTPGEEVSFTRSEPPGREIPPSLVMTDGGVYDNLTDQWLLALDYVQARLTNHVDGTTGTELQLEIQQEIDAWDVPDLIVIGSAKSGAKWKRLQGPGNATLYPMWLLDLYQAVFPLGTMNKLKRDFDIQYDNGPEIRRRELQHWEWRTERRSILAHVEMTPSEYGLNASSADAIEDGNLISLQVPDAVAALDAAGPHPPWVELRDYTSRQWSWPYPLGAKRTARLMFHAYALTYVGLHVNGYLALPAGGGPNPRTFDEFVDFATIK